MKVLIAMLGPLAAVFKFRWLLNLIPGVGPLLATALEAIVVALKFVARGVFGIVTSPTNLVAAIVIAMVAVAGGIRVGVKLDAHLVREANKTIAERTEQRDVAKAEIRLWNERLAEEKTRADAAQKASAEAKAKVESDQAAADARARAKRLRDGAGGAAAKSGPKNSGGAGLSAWSPWKL